VDAQAVSQQAGDPRHRAHHVTRIHVLNHRVPCREFRQR
jgi:hypothetical protein